MSSFPEPTVGHMATHNYIPNEGYLERKPNDLRSAEKLGEIGDERSTTDSGDDDFQDIFEEDEDAADYAANYPGAITKAFNRQRRAQEVATDPNAPKSTMPRTNPQKPTANTLASIDDQVRDLSRHAGKLRINDGLAGLGEKRQKGQERSDRATNEQVLDPRTRMILLQMINRNVISEVNGCVSTGKEANVYHAMSESEDGTDFTPVHRAIKIHKSRIVVFKDRERYVAGDHRFSRGFSRGNNRAMVKQWADKEFRNLNRVFTAGIPCPKPLYLRLHVILMEFIGDQKGIPAPKLKDVVFEDAAQDEESDKIEEKWRDLYLQLLSYMRLMYTECRLVHGDLSEYNVLYHEGKLWIIDVSQAVEHDHPKSLEFLRMDIKNVNEFFGRKGVDTLTDRTVFESIVSSSGPRGKVAVDRSLEELFVNRPNEGATDDAEKEVENEVFRQQYIPQTLDQVYDIEKDGEQINKEGKHGLVYKDLLADKVVAHDIEKGSDGSVSEGGGVGLEDDENSTSSRSDYEESEKKPRGKRFEDKDTKREHKKQVKEEKREKRENKMPKHLKKRLVKATSRRKA
ncbi:MAG: hypothetical protein LQ340_007645 [Diploschistes diacapsis]|nr:MAG: hypothetical protein LQ340_007645 [Diploschistes diacapsis]